ncbi:hypothetical protein GOP47_0010673 [Adiantum capillus-veneris]|uniref:Uncharacterized protein n=1 Tax=Adiantum capillus-veneris TaxID=13818 RepID=A0A9D4UWH2_ADICA|nr:hypothetical protein GOP47_0010673 [Adiantum capillus-veneris]
MTGGVVATAVALNNDSGKGLQDAGEGLHSSDRVQSMGGTIAHGNNVGRWAVPTSFKCTTTIVDVNGGRWETQRAT